jgi:hypothetical protein
MWCLLPSESDRATGWRREWLLMFCDASRGGFVDMQAGVLAIDGAKPPKKTRLTASPEASSPSPIPTSAIRRRQQTIDSIASIKGNVSRQSAQCILPVFADPHRLFAG